METTPDTSPVYNGDKLLIFTAIYVPVQVACVALRYLSRYLVEGPWGLDDAVVMTSLLLQMCMAGLSVGIESQRSIFLNSVRLLMQYSICQVRWGWSPYTISTAVGSAQGGSVGKISRGHLDSVLCWCQCTKNGDFSALPSTFSKQKQSNSHTHRHGFPGWTNLFNDSYSLGCL